MATDYEQFYRDNKHGLGQPSKPFVDFFRSHSAPGARVLDVGCGQGRDALFIARMGHRVTALDLSSTGIEDLVAEARQERLEIDAHVGDIRDFQWPGPFEIILVDRTLHMLGDEMERVRVLEDLIAQTLAGSHMLIADERANLPAFERAFRDSGFGWSELMTQRGYLFMKRE